MYSRLDIKEIELDSVCFRGGQGHVSLEAIIQHRASMRTNTCNNILLNE